MLWPVALGWHLVGVVVYMATASMKITHISAEEYAVYECPLNTRCHCISRPNSSQILQVRCSAIRLYKFPELPYNSVKIVAIQNNHVRSVDDETLNGLTLEKLLLDNNQLFAISENSLRSMVNTLRDLDLSNNQFQVLPRALHRLRALGRLSFHGNLLQSLDGDWSGLAQSIRVLRLSANSICQLNELHHGSSSSSSSSSKITTAISHHSHPTKDGLGSSSASAVQTTHISSSTGSIKPKFQQSSHSFPPGTTAYHHTNYSTTNEPTKSMHLHQTHSFAQLHRLGWLDLSSNRISELNTRLLPPALVTLDVSHNLLNHIPPDLFTALTQLKFLLLSGNLIENLASTSMAGSSNSANKHLHLEKLDLGDNRLRSTHSLLPGHHTATIKALTLARNSLQHISADAFRHLHIQHLVLAFNRIKTLDANAFRTLDETLEYLDLEHNLLNHTHPVVLERLQRLQYLYFTANRLQDVEFPLPSTLLVLSLAGNHLKRIPYAALLGCTQLTYLNVGYNQIADMGAVITPLLSAASSSTTIVSPTSTTTEWETSTTTTDSIPPISEENLQPDSEELTTSLANAAGFKHWASALQTLLLRNNKLTELTADCFAGLSSIREISLSFNDLHWIHPNCFVPVADTLQILELSFGVRTSDADGGFPVRLLRPLQQLVWLGLDNNRLTGLPADAFATLTRLRYINLAFNRLDSLPAHLFDSEIHGTLVEVDLAYNRLTQLGPFVFDSLVGLERIQLAHNRLSTLNRQCFNNLPQLQSVDLSHNRLTNISAEAFALLPRLSWLDLRYNELIALWFGWFRGVSVFDAATGAGMASGGLMTLNMSHNRIENIVQHATNQPPAIGTLDVSYNRLALDRDETAASSYSGDGGLQLAGLRETLRDLWMRGNVAFGAASSDANIDSTPPAVYTLTSRAFGSMSRLEQLDLSAGALTVLRRRSFHGLERLQTLNLSHNRIGQLQPEQFGNLRRLRVLDLSGNRLHVVGGDVFARTRIEWLDVSANRLSDWPTAALADVGFTLRSVRASNNRIAHLVGSMFAHTPFLADVDVADNQLESATAADAAKGAFVAGLLANLTRLDMSGNVRLAGHLMQMLQPAYAAMTKAVRSVRELRIANVGLTSMPSRLPDVMPSLAILDVRGNRLQSLPASLRHMRYLHTLQLAANRFLSLSEILQKLPGSLRTLDVSYNEVAIGNRSECCDVNNIRNLDHLNVIGFIDNAVAESADNMPCFWSNLGVLRILHVSLRPHIRNCFSYLLGIEELYLVADIKMMNSPVDPDYSYYTDELRNSQAQQQQHYADNGSNGKRKAYPNRRLLHIDGAAMPRLHSNVKLRLLDLTGMAIGSLAPDTFESLRDNHRLTVRLHRTGIRTLPGGLFYVLHAVSNLAVQVSDNRRLGGLSPNVFYPNVSVWDAVGTRSIVGGLDVYNNAVLGCDCGLVWLGHWLRRWLRETAQMNVVTREEGAAMLERARRNGCTDPATGAYISFLDLFPEDLMCHASALSSSSSSWWWSHSIRTPAQLLIVFLIVYVRS